jgi:hypothetical protein
VALRGRGPQQRWQEHGLDERDSTRVATIETVENNRDTGHNEGGVNKATSETRQIVCIQQMEGLVMNLQCSSGVPYMRMWGWKRIQGRGVRSG